MRRAFTLLAIFILSDAAAVILAPPDAATCYIFAGVFTLWGISSYLVGIREGKKLSHLADNKT